MHFKEKIFSYFFRMIEEISLYFASKTSILFFDKIYCIAKFRRTLHQKLDLNNPIRFNEKIQWLKLYDRNPLYTQLADKYAVREYVSNKVGSHILNELYGVFSDANDIDFDLLPDQFILKATHGCNWNILCQDKSQLDLHKTKEKLREWLELNFYFIKGEWVYKNIKPQIICEKFLEGDKNYGLMDYRFFCFNGNPIYIAIDSSKYFTEIQRVIYDLNWVRQPFNISFPPLESEINRPSQLELMVDYARKLSSGIPFCRVDFYNFDSKIYFGEITFYHRSGFGEFFPEEYDKILGDLLPLPKV